MSVNIKRGAAASERVVAMSMSIILISIRASVNNMDYAALFLNYTGRPANTILIQLFFLVVVVVFFYAYILLR